MINTGDRKPSSESSIETAIDVIQTEIQLEKIKESLRIDFEKATKAHDSIKAFFTFPTKFVPTSRNDLFQKNSAFFVYHWDTCELASRANIDALATFYNSSFILLRSVLELLFMGAFLDCVAHKKYRENSSILDKTTNGRKLKKFTSELITLKPTIDSEFETVSGAVFDKLSDYLLDKDNRISFHKMLEQLTEWGILQGIKNPVEMIYDVYERLSLDTHGHPDYIDNGRILTTDRDLFKERQVIPNHLLEFFERIHSIMDLAMIVTLNILQENVQNFDVVKQNLQNLLSSEQFLKLELTNTRQRLVQILDNVN